MLVLFRELQIEVFSKWQDFWRKYYPHGWRVSLKPARLGLDTFVKNTEIFLLLNKNSIGYVTFNNEKNN